MKYLSKIVLVSLMGLMFLGCQEQPVPMQTNWPITIDKGLEYKIAVINSISRKRSDNLSEVQFILKNRLPHSSVNALYQINWFDVDGFRIKSITDTFMKIDLGPAQEKIFSVISVSPKAYSYKIAIVDYDKNKKRVPNDNIQNDN